MPLTCRNVQHLHQEFVDGELSASLVAEVHAHLLQCPACQKAFEITRACEDVVANDASEPQLRPGFASQLVARIQQQAAAQPARPAPRRSRLWRYAGAAGIPAAAAIVLLAIVIWPRGGTDQPPRFVAGRAVEASGVGEFVSPTVDAVNETRDAARSLTQLLHLSAAEARQQVENGLGRTRQLDAAIGMDAAKEGQTPPAAKSISLMDVLLLPFDTVLQPTQEQEPAPDADPDVVRF